MFICILFICFINFNIACLSFYIIYLFLVSILFISSIVMHCYMSIYLHVINFITIIYSILHVYLFVYYLSICFY